MNIAYVRFPDKSTYYKYLGAVDVQPLQYVEMPVPSSQHHGVHGAALRAHRRQKA